jgi:hypothetical protein
MLSCFVFAWLNLRSLIPPAAVCSQPVHLIPALPVACAHFAQIAPLQMALNPFPFIRFRTFEKITGHRLACSGQNLPALAALRPSPPRVSPILATHPKNAPVTPFPATHTKTKDLQLLYLPHIRKKDPSPRNWLTRISDFIVARPGLPASFYLASRLSASTSSAFQFVRCRHLPNAGKLNLQTVSPAQLTQNRGIHHDA